MTESPVPTPNWTHYAEAVRVIDGDTLVARIDLGKYPTKFLAEAVIRINGLYAPEKRDEGGADALMALDAFVVGKGPIVLQTRKPDPRDPYGRIVADVWASDGTFVAEAMIAAGHGKATR